MRILFYLPAISINWFNDSLVPLIRASAQAADVHVIVPPYWNGTGITEQELAGCLDLDHVGWHILDEPDHPSFRTRPDRREPLIALVREIAPDYTFCRSADVTTPAAFPGKVRYLMEAEFAPSLEAAIPRGGRMMVTGPRFYDFGFVPPLGEALAERLDHLLEPAWTAVSAATAAGHTDREAYLASVGLPGDRPIVAVPLQLQSSENVFGQVHGSEETADRFVEKILAGLGEDFLLAVAVHPIDRREGTRGPLDRVAAMTPGRVRIVEQASERYRGETTERLIRHCDGLVVAESKSISLGAYFAKPILRLSNFAAADWIGAYRDLPTFRAALAHGTAVTADPGGLRRWYGYHFANNAFAAVEADLAELLDRADCPTNPDRWERALRHHAGQG